MNPSDFDPSICKALEAGFCSDERRGYSLKLQYLMFDVEMAIRYFAVMINPNTPMLEAKEAVEIFSAAIKE